MSDQTKLQDMYNRKQIEKLSSSLSVNNLNIHGQTFQSKEKDWQDEIKKQNKTWFIYMLPPRDLL